MTIKELKANSHLLSGTKTRRCEETNTLTVFNTATNEDLYTFTFETEKEMVIADCELFNSKLAQAMVERRVETATIIKTGGGKSMKTGFVR